MTDSVELRKLVKQLQSAPTPSDIISVLGILKDLPTVTEPILRETKAGLAVGKLRAHASKEVADLAKEIVKKWKTAVEKAKQASGVAKQPNGKLDRKSSTPATPTVASATPRQNSNSVQDTRNAKIDGIKGGTDDTTRNKCVELIYDALASDSPAPTELILSRSRKIEKCIYEDNGDMTTKNYKQQIRTLYVNLKDKSNPALRETVVSGDLPVEKLTKMTSQEMASEERKAADNKIKEENLFKSLSAEEQQAETEGFQCSRCKQRKCRYRQAQTRSADEPMTTFVTCTNCGNRWKFS